MRLAISTTETLTDLKTDLVVANNNNVGANILTDSALVRAKESTMFGSKLGEGRGCLPG